MSETIESYQCVACKVFTTQPFESGDFLHRCDKCSKIHFENSVRWKSTMYIKIPDPGFARFMCTA